MEYNVLSWSLAELINTQPSLLLALHVAPNPLHLYGVGPVVQVGLGHEVLALTEHVTQLLHPCGLSCLNKEGSTPLRTAALDSSASYQQASSSL